MGHNRVNDFYRYHKKMANQACGHQNGLFEWKFRLGSVHGNTIRSQTPLLRSLGLQAQKGYIWTQTSL